MLLIHLVCVEPEEPLFFCMSPVAYGFEVGIYFTSSEATRNSLDKISDYGGIAYVQGILTPSEKY